MPGVPPSKSQGRREIKVSTHSTEELQLRITSCDHEWTPDPVKFWGYMTADYVCRKCKDRK